MERAVPGRSVVTAGPDDRIAPTPAETLSPLIAELDRRLRERGADGSAGDHCCAFLATVFGFDLVWIGEPAGNRRVQVRAVRGRAESLAASLAELPARTADSEPLGRALSTAEPQLWTSGGPQPGVWARLSGLANFAESLSIPIKHGGETLAVLTAHSARAGVLTPELSAALLPVADRLGMVLSDCRSETRLKVQSLALMAAANGIVITDRNGTIDWVNDGFLTLTGYEAEELIGDSPRILNSGAHDPAVYDKLWKTILGGEVWRGEMINRCKNGSLVTIRETITPVLDSGGAVTHFIAVHEDITACRDAEERSAYFMAHDVLTGLPNRALMRDRLQQAMLWADRNARAAVLILVDIDQFRDVNETHGHGVGDALILAVSEAIRNSVRRSDTVARFGADEFAAILGDIASPSDAWMLAGRIQDAIGRIQRVDGQPLRVSASIGGAIYPADAGNPDSLIQSAELALRSAKANRPQVQFYSRRLSEETRARSALRHDLAKALRAGEFFLNFQPQIDLATGQVSGLEALARWRSPTRGFVSPGEFIPVAEESGLIVDLGAWVIDEVCRQLACWQRQGITGLRVAINISTVQVRHGQLLTDVEDSVTRHNLSAASLEFELTESVLLNQSTQAARELTSLHAMGINWAVDDFGTGYSSLEYLRTFPIDKLKIDRSFVSGMIDDDNDLAIVRSVIGLAKNLNLRVIAEGVETPEQVARLREFGCDEIQGYVFSPPIAADAIPAKIAETLDAALAARAECAAVSS
ncbi:MAG: EAL domain-containing protein [Alphaproteobacteria bacterium]|jgi:diguanylate cyclase (GGDEF)-like protein/PAS domain S-box-containing protein|nr:EAL domain-containing protein [Alphaproteobacteria bacterium]